jgi:hypothetical protein
MPSKKTIIKKKKTKQKQKQKQKQVQNVIVNVNQSGRRRSNYTPKDKPQPRPQSQSVNVMPAHHTFYVDTGRPQYNTLRAPEPAVSESLRAPEPVIAPLREPEEIEERPKRGRPIGSKNRPVIIAEPVPVTPRFNPFQQELMKATEKRRKEREELGLENSSDEATHQGLNVSSSSLMNQPFAENNLESLVSNVESPKEESLAGGAYENPNPLNDADIQIYNDYMSMKADELKQICKDKGIPAYGSKRDMTFRLMGISEPKRQYNKKSNNIGFQVNRE